MLNNEDVRIFKLGLLSQFNSQELVLWIFYVLHVAAIDFFYFMENVDWINEGDCFFKEHEMHLIIIDKDNNLSEHPLLNDMNFLGIKL